MPNLDYSDLFPKTLVDVANRVVRCGIHNVALRCPDCNQPIPTPVKGVVRCPSCDTAALCDQCASASCHS